MLNTNLASNLSYLLGGYASADCEMAPKLRSHFVQLCAWNYISFSFSNLWVFAHYTLEKALWKIKQKQILYVLSMALD